MPEKIAETDLLDLIEGELEPGPAADLRQRLAGDRQLLALVERLQDDREILRSMDDPPMPADLLAELEPMMARPMLMPDSGDWRRRYRRRRPWRRYVAVAAAVCLALLAGVWAVTSGVLDATPASETTLAVSDLAPPSEMAVAEEAAEPDVWPPAGATVHHRGPVGDAGQLAAGDPQRRRPPGPRRAPEVEPALTTVDFVLVVNAGGDDAPAVQETLQRVLGRLEGDVALVRNFSFQEAEQLARRLDAEDARRLNRELTLARADFAGIAGAGDRNANAERLVRRRRVASRFARSLEQSGTALGGGLAPSGQLVGPRSLAPSYEQQLEYAEGGATWTITVAADRLNDVLAGLRITEGRDTLLRIRRDGGAAPADADPWRDYPRILQGAAALDGTVMVPVVVE